MLKKILLAAFVVITFGIYSLHQRSGDGGAASHVTTNSTSTSQPASSPTTTTAYRDGSYTGTAADAYYGYIQVKAVISGGKLTDVEFLQYPNDQRTSVEINSQAMPILKQQALQVQSAHVDGVSGASDTSQAFIQSLSDALQQAHA